MLWQEFDHPRGTPKNPLQVGPPEPRQLSQAGLEVKKEFDQRISQPGHSQTEIAFVVSFQDFAEELFMPVLTRASRPRSSYLEFRRYSSRCSFECLGLPGLATIVSMRAIFV